MPRRSPRSPNSTHTARVGSRSSEEQISDPECPTAEWWWLAEKYPVAAIQSPLYPLMILEAPDRWVEIEARHAADWINKYANHLPLREDRLFGADCAERVLPLWERVHKNARPRQAIAVARAYAMGKATEDQLENARTRVDEALDDVGNEDERGLLRGAYLAGGCARNVVCPPFHSDQWYHSGLSISHDALDAVFKFTLDQRHWSDAAEARAAQEAERLWQWHRLLTYLLPAESVGATDERTAAQRIIDPECPMEDWWTLAADWPLAALASPLYDLLTLEEPERWFALEKQHLQTWLRSHIKLLSEADQRLFAADVAEHVLPLWERKLWKDPRPRRSIEVARRFARGQSTPVEMDTINDAANEAVHEIANDKSLVAACSAADAAKWASIHWHAESAAKNALSAALAAVYNEAMDTNKHWSDAADARAAEEVERLWQWRRLIQYCRGMLR